jgi:putative SOS response-associated peptidase YedK
MCGRYATTRSSADLSALFESYDETGGALSADYNVAPTDPVPIVRMSRRRSGRVLSVARWGLVPPWAKDLRGAAKMINARAETVATSPAYARSFADRRCLVPADGWYEWVRSASGQKQAYYMTPEDGSPLAFAGVWSVWGSSEPVITCSIITTAAMGELALVHDRMPLVLHSTRWPAWLTDNRDTGKLLAAPAPEEATRIELRPVGAAVGDVRNDGPALIERVSAAPLDRPSVDPIELTLF